MAETSREQKITHKTHNNYEKQCDNISKMLRKSVNDYLFYHARNGTKNR